VRVHSTSINLQGKQTVHKQTPISLVMTTSLCTADRGDTLDTVRRLMLEQSFHHVPILDRQKLVGIISSRDLVGIYSKARAGDAGAIDPSTARAEAVMQTNLVTLRSDDSLDKAVNLLAEGAIHSVLVLDDGGELVGIATNHDLLEYLLS
jgi:CBS domain-containing protein